MFVRSMLVLASVALALPATAARPLGAPEIATAAVGCACDVDPGPLLALRDRISEASSLDEARELATREVMLASAALSRARTFAPWSTGLGTAHERLENYTQRVSDAASTEHIAAEFSALMKLDASEIGYAGGCDYTTGEVIAIVLGFILGIIPGIILLLLLC